MDSDDISLRHKNIKSHLHHIQHRQKFYIKSLGGGHRCEMLNFLYHIVRVIRIPTVWKSENFINLLYKLTMKSYFGYKSDTKSVIIHIKYEVKTFITDVIM